MKFETMQDVQKHQYAVLTVSRDEAIAIIASLSSQIISKSPNVGRKEFVSEDGVYIDIFVKGERDR